MFSYIGEIMKRFLKESFVYYYMFILSSLFGDMLSVDG